MKILDPSWVQMMSIEKSALNKSCSSGSKLYSSWEHLLCCSPWSPQFFRRHLRFLLGTLFYRNLALLFQWLLKLSHAGVGLDEHFGSHEAKAFEATLWVEPCYHLIHVTQQARSELDSFWMKQKWKMCPGSLPNALQLLVGTRSVGQPDREPSNRGTAWCQVLSTALSRLRQVLRSRTAGSGRHCLPFSARCCWAASGCFT